MNQYSCVYKHTYRDERKRTFFIKIVRVIVWKEGKFLAAMMENRSNCLNYVKKQEIYNWFEWNRISKTRRCDKSTKYRMTGALHWIWSDHDSRLCTCTWRHCNSSFSHSGALLPDDLSAHRSSMASCILCITALYASDEQSCQNGQSKI